MIFKRNMTYYNPSLSGFRGYFRAKEPGKRERAEAWATAIGLQKVDGLSASVPIRADIGR